MRMYAATRAGVTLVAVLVCGFLMWLGSRIYVGPNYQHRDRYWAYIGLLALSGLVMALSQLAGGWTKWGWPRLSGKVFFVAFLPTLILGGWVLAAYEPGNHWLAKHLRSWSADLHIRSIVVRLGVISLPAIAFLIGLVLGLSVDTTGPRVKKAAAPDEKRGDGEPVSPEPKPEPPPRSGEPAEDSPGSNKAG
jgi:hypothetical protein